MQSVSVDILISQQKPRSAGFYIYFDVLYAIKLAKAALFIN